MPKTRWLLLLTVLLCKPAITAAGPDEAADVAAARAVFEANLEAIRKHDRDAYLACYLESDRLVRTGADGFTLGYKDLAASAGTGWPDVIEAQDLRFVRLQPGLVYGTYRYRVRFGEVEQSGLSERLFSETPQGWRIAVTTAFGATTRTAPPARALVGGTLVDGTGAPAVPDSTVILRDGKIECAGPRAACPVPEGTGVTDVSGHWIVPGLIDAHVHFSQTGWADGRPDSMDLRKDFPYETAQAGLREHPERFFRTYLCSGVTAVFDVGGYAWTLDLGARAAADGRAPHVVAAGPLLSTIDFWLNLPAERQFMHLKDADAAPELVRYLATRGSKAVKVWYIVTPDQSVEALAPAVMAAGAEAKKAGLPLIVHATGLAEAKAALRAGARLLVHSVWDQPVDDEFVELIRSSGAIYCPTLTVMGGYVRMYQAAQAGQAARGDDPNGCLDAETRSRLEATAKAAAPDAAKLASRAERVAQQEPIGAANLKRLSDAGIPIAMGTDAGNPLTLHGTSVYAELEAMAAAGLTPMQVLVAATRGGSLAMGLEKEIGTVEKGKAADLLVLDADPTTAVTAWRKVSAVVRGGVLRPVAELKAPVKSAQP